MSRLLAIALLLPCILTGCSADDSGARNDSAPDASAEQDAATGGEVAAATWPEGCRDGGTAGATAACLRPTMPPEYYVEQGLKYFDTLDVDASPESVPRYHAQVARWEWPPWLLLTGYGKSTMETTATLLRRFDPSTVPERDCRFFETQPFCRCYVVFEYEGGSCPVYEEFIFNDDGEMTWIEAWSDLPHLLPQDRDADPWAETTDIDRLGTKIPGLGNATGSLDLDDEWMRAAAEADADVAEFAKRAADQWTHWTRELQAAGDDLFARGCGW